MMKLLPYPWLIDRDRFLRRLLGSHRWRWLAVVASIVAVLVTLSVPVQASYDVSIQPTAPRQGDTVSIIAVGKQNTGASPRILVNGTQFPTFPIGRDRYRAFLPTSPLHASGEYVIRIEGIEGSRNPMVWLSDRAFSTQYITLAPGQRDLGTDYEFDKVDAFKRLVTPEKYWNGPFLRPSQGYVSSEYGVRRYYNGEFAQDYYHRGIDYAASIGSPVAAPAAGRVALIGHEADGFELHGNTIGLDHGQGVASIFIHLNSINVQEGEFVQPGQVIGAIGTTGASTGPHLHWGLYVNGVAVDPEPWRNRGFE
jgi:murein DD-endopeptidase MepM/ murein hydrolase activator NlpD